MKVLKTLVLASGVVLAASVGYAATFTTGSTACSIIDVGPNADDCWGFAAENANAAQLNLNPSDVGRNETLDTFDDGYLFGYADWETFQTDGDYGGGTSGAFDIVANAYEEVVVILKSANTFAAYLFEDGLSGELSFWTGNDRGLSNYRVVGRGELSEISLPASALLLIGGLGGLVLMRRRKS